LIYPQKVFCEIHSFPRVVILSMASVQCVSGTIYAAEEGSWKGKLTTEAESALQSLALSWADVIDANQLEIVPLTGGMTNEIFRCSWKTREDKKPRKVLLRIYGADSANVFFDREYEIRAFESISRLGHGPRLLASFPNGRIEEFLNARTLSATDLKNPEISAKIAAKLWEFHHLDIPGPREPKLWMRLRCWLRKALDLCHDNEVAEFQLDCMEEEINNLEMMLIEDQRLGFCHNDLQYANLMFDEDDQSLTLIDYDCSSYDYVAFDIANHFCEMAGNYHSDQPHILDYNKYPDFEERQRFVKKYLNSSSEMTKEEEVEQLLQYIEKYTLVCHVHWALWSLISGHVNNIDFDFVDYARQRFQQYHLLKALTLKDESPYSSSEMNWDWDYTIDFENNKELSQSNANMHYECQIIEW